MIVLVGILLFCAIYFYTWRVADVMDLQHEQTVGLLREVLTTLERLQRDHLAALKEQTAAFAELRRTLTRHDSYLIEIGRELSLSTMTLRDATATLKSDLALKSESVVQQWVREHQLEVFAAGERLQSIRNPPDDDAAARPSS